MLYISISQSFWIPDKLLLNNLRCARPLSYVASCLPHIHAPFFVHSKVIPNTSRMHSKRECRSRCVKANPTSFRMSRLAFWSASHVTLSFTCNAQCGCLPFSSSLESKACVHFDRECIVFNWCLWSYGFLWDYLELSTEKNQVKLFTCISLSWCECGKCPFLSVHDNPVSPLVIPQSSGSFCLWECKRGFHCTCSSKLWNGHHYGSCVESCRRIPSEDSGLLILSGWLIWMRTEWKKIEWSSSKTLILLRFLLLVKVVFNVLITSRIGVSYSLH